MMRSRILFILLMVMLLPVAAHANLYQQKCAMCHGAEGIAKMPGVPNLAQTALSLEQIEVIIEKGRGKMPKMQLDTEQRREVAQFILTNIKK